MAAGYLFQTLFFPVLFYYYSFHFCAIHLIAKFSFIFIVMLQVTLFYFYERIMFTIKCIALKGKQAGAELCQAQVQLC